MQGQLDLADGLAELVQRLFVVPALAHVLAAFPESNIQLSHNTRSGTPGSPSNITRLLTESRTLAGELTQAAKPNLLVARRRSLSWLKDL